MLGSRRDVVQEDFDAFVLVHWDSLVKSAILFGCNPTDAQDAVQSAMLQCFRHWAKVKAARDPRAYVHRVLINRIKTDRRRRWHAEAAAGELESEDPTDSVDVEQRLTVQKALSQLPDEQRAVLVLRFFVDLTEAQTAAVLEVPLGTVKSRASRALHVLAENEQFIGMTGDKRC